MAVRGCGGELRRERARKAAKRCAGALLCACVGAPCACAMRPRGDVKRPGRAAQLSVEFSLGSLHTTGLNLWC